MTDPTAVENAFTSLVLATGLIRDTYPEDPRMVPGTLPALSMVLTQTTPVQGGPLGLILLQWRWNVYIYIKLKDWDEAQRDLKAMMPGLATLITDASAPQYRTLSNTVSEAWLLDEGAEPDFRPDDELLVKRLTLTAITEEVPI